MTLEDLKAHVVRPEPERDQYQRYLIVPETGGRPVPHTRATTVASTLEERYNLELWKLRMSAIGFARRPDLYAKAVACPADDKAKLNKIVEEAVEAGGASVGANTGTALHGMLERIDAGEELVVPAPWDRDVLAYETALATAGISIVRALIERIVVLPDIQVAGTLDRIVEYAEQQFIADLKTGASLDFGWCSISMQLSLYSRAKTMYDPATRTHTPMPPVNRNWGLVIHLPAGQGTCSLHWVNLRRGWEAVNHALWTREWRRRKDLNLPFNGCLPGGPQR